VPNAYHIDNDTIIIERDLTELDIFVKDFLNILKKHSDYLIVSGYVSIATGRTRGTEDVDLLLPPLSEETFTQLFNELTENGFWCYQGDSADMAYKYIQEVNNIRFARSNQMFPNMEIVPFNETKRTKSFEFNHPQKIKIKDFEFKIPQLEFEILYKELVLTGKKDIADARHLRIFFVDILKKEKFETYEAVIKYYENLG